MQSIEEIANRDHTVTKEEKIVIKSVKQFIEEYNTILSNNDKEDLSIEQKEKIKILKKSLIDKVWKISSSDKVISNEESDIISTLYNYLLKLEV